MKKKLDEFGGCEDSFEAARPRERWTMKCTTVLLPLYLPLFETLHSFISTSSMYEVIMIHSFPLNHSTSSDTKPIHHIRPLTQHYLLLLRCNTPPLPLPLPNPFIHTSIPLPTLILDALSIHKLALESSPALLHH
jgi:hypothetical protein